MKLSNLFSNPPALAKYSFILLAAFLVVLAFLSFGRVDSSHLEQTIMYATYALLMFLDAAIMLFFALRLGSKNKKVYQFALVFIILNIILTIFDQIGIIDILFILLNGFALYVLYVYSDEFSDVAG